MELKSKIDGNALIGLLHSVPESVSSSDLGIWLKDDVLPCMLCHFSEKMVSFTSWLTDRIQRLELTEQVSAAYFIIFPSLFCSLFPLLSFFLMPSSSSSSFHYSSFSPHSTLSHYPSLILLPSLPHYSSFSPPPPPSPFTITLPLFILRSSLSSSSFSSFSSFFSFSSFSSFYHHFTIIHPSLLLLLLLPSLTHYLSFSPPSLPPFYHHFPIIHPSLLLLLLLLFPIIHPPLLLLLLLLLLFSIILSHQFPHPTISLSFLFHLFVFFIYISPLNLFNSLFTPAIPLPSPQATWPSNAIQLLDLVIKYITTNKEELEEHFGIQAKQCITSLQVNTNILYFTSSIKKVIDTKMILCYVVMLIFAC